MSVHVKRKASHPNTNIWRPNQRTLTYFSRLVIFRDQLIRSADNSQIAWGLKERIPKSANIVNQRIASLLSSEAAPPEDTVQFKGMTAKTM